MKSTADFLLDYSTLLLSINIYDKNWFIKISLITSYCKSVALLKKLLKVMRWWWIVQRKQTGTLMYFLSFDKKLENFLVNKIKVIIGTQNVGKNRNRPIFICGLCI